MCNAKQLINELRSDDVTAQLAIECLSHTAALVRVNAIEILGKFALRDGTYVQAIAKAAVDPTNNVKLLGNTTVAHAAIGTLLKIGTPDACNKAMDAIKIIPHEQVCDLEWYLQSEGIQHPTHRSCQY